jgi:hypothetical protein
LVSVSAEAVGVDSHALRATAMQLIANARIPTGGHHCSELYRFAGRFLSSEILSEFTQYFTQSRSVNVVYESEVSQCLMWFVVVRNRQQFIGTLEESYNFCHSSMNLI